MFCPLFSQATNPSGINAAGTRKWLTAVGRKQPFDDKNLFGYGLVMTDEDRQMLREMIDYCDKQYEAADQDMASPCDSPVLAARRKSAYAKVARHARLLLAENGG